MADSETSGLESNLEATGAPEPSASAPSPPMRPGPFGGMLRTGNPGKRPSPRAAWIERAKTLVQVRAINRLDRRLQDETEAAKFENRDLIALAFRKDEKAAGDVNVNVAVQVVNGATFRANDDPTGS